jgi:DedD protein
MAASQDTEITLGTGRILTVFFVLVAVCALFFGIGYSMGKNSVKTESAEQTAVSDAKVAAKAVTNQPTPPKPNPAEGMTFFQAVKQSDTVGAANSRDPSPVVSSKRSDEAVPDPKDDEKGKEKKEPVVGMVTAGTSYVVQVAAVTKKEDAEALVSALRKKNYDVSASTNEPHDRLYHVQVGPFSEFNDADAVRARLVGDGYNPIVKR